MSILFKEFNEMKKYNSTAFVEIQYCKLSDSKNIEKRVAVRNIC